uniref:Adenosine 5'-monophosphoramidase HINT3 n=2 Tax=Petromyzon marinus TaxID=7757 RepID=A0AAJ7TF06_PETMA|nr:histidine triad nucleotide-binding protein 3 isoform X1 [Petromyzon marinus]
MVQRHHRQSSVQILPGSSLRRPVTISCAAFLDCCRPQQHLWRPVYTRCCCCCLDLLEMSAEGSPQLGDGRKEDAAETRRDTEPTCLFCKIANGQQEDCELVYQDEHLSSFRDIHPGAPHHYLVVPRDHVGNCKSLRRRHVALVNEMVRVGKEVLQRQGVSDLSDIRLGFHWPPFSSVTHLHLHVLAPASQIGFLRLAYRLNTWWFVTSDQLIKILEAFPEESAEEGSKAH